MKEEEKIMKNFREDRESGRRQSLVNKKTQTVQKDNRIANDTTVFDTQYDDESILSEDSRISSRSLVNELIRGESPQISVIIPHSSYVQETEHAARLTQREFMSIISPDVKINTQKHHLEYSLKNYDTELNDEAKVFKDASITDSSATMKANDNKTDADITEEDYEYNYRRDSTINPSTVRNTLQNIHQEYSDEQRSSSTTSTRSKTKNKLARPSVHTQEDEEKYKDFKTRQSTLYKK